MSAAIITAAVPIVKSIVSHFASGTKAAAKGVASAASGRAALVVVAIWCYPFISSFIPFLQPFTIKGFAVIENLPAWYTDYFIGISVAYVGAHEIRRGVTKHG
jgi:hypothetical protein